MDLGKCDECGSDFKKIESQMTSLCPECAHHLYDYENCNHIFVNNVCKKCNWDGSTSDFIKNND